MIKIDKKIERLENLHRVDLGFYVLGLHSFIESYITSVTNYDEKSFRKNLYSFNDYLRRRSLDEMHRSFINDLVNDHAITNDVRHNFEEIFSHEAEGATYRFIKFLKKTDIDSEYYTNLQDLYKRWNSRTNHSAEDSKILQSKLKEAKDKIFSMEEELSDHRELKKRLDKLNKENSLLSLQIETGKGDVKEIEDEKSLLKESIKELKESMDGVEAMEKYILYLNRFSLYTRTRDEYEKSVLRLSSDQKTAVDRITLRKDFLVKGAAGTGKSLVLIKAIDKVMDLHSLGKELINGKVLLLSFSRTLKKYNQYMAELLKSGLDSSSINTVDSFITSRFLQIFPGYSINYNPEIKLPKDGVGRLDFKNLEDEIETFILPGIVTKEEYCVTGGIVRSGMKIKGLKEADRILVWEAFEEYCDFLEATKEINLPYLRYKLINYLRDNNTTIEKDISYMFVDEVQDMTPCSLAILKEFTDGPVIMAGDENQKIFAATSPFKRSGINIQGSTVHLRENFRNTNQIIGFANKIIGQDSSDLDILESFRDGPEPEVHRCKSTSKTLIEKLKIYHEELGYELHNIAVIVPDMAGRGVNSLIKKINKEGYETSQINDSFDFKSEDSIRITSLRNCKGLDFPVVLLYLPYMTSAKGYDDETTSEMEKNLLYVACTRAMDNLDIFISDKPKGILENLF